jgi:hypothetical protein
MNLSRSRHGGSGVAQVSTDAGAPRPSPLMVSYFFHPDYSGSSVQAFNLSRRLLARGVVPRIVSANLSGAARSERRDGIAVDRLLTVTSAAGALPSFWVSLVWYLIRHHRE